MSAPLPAVVLWAIPWVALGLGLFTLGMTATYGFLKRKEWLDDQRREGPKIRRFYSLTCRVKEFKANLTAFSEGRGTRGWRLGQFNVLNAEAAMIRTELEDLGIETPIFDHAANQEHVEYLISYLGAVEQFARQGDLHEARRKIRLEPEWLYTGPKHGEVHDS